MNNMEGKLQYILGCDGYLVNTIVNNMCHRNRAYYKLRMFVLPKILTNPSAFSELVDYYLDVFAVAIYKIKEQLYKYRW